MGTKDPRARSGRTQSSQPGATQGAADSARPATSHGAAHPELVGVPILIVDDDAASAKLLAVTLGGEGCDVRIARSAEDALVLLRGFKPRVVIIDLILPLMSGWLFAQRLKSDHALEDVVLMAVTAFNGVEAERVARQSGFTAYVRKPIDPIAFTQIVIEQLGGAA
jgi:CheY-like chemotaxis protein